MSDDFESDVVEKLADYFQLLAGSCVIDHLWLYAEGERILREVVSLWRGEV